MNNIDQIVTEYLERLERNLGGRAGERSEILSEIESHIHTRLNELGPEQVSDQRVLNVLKELGSPEVIAQEFYSTSDPQELAGVLQTKPSKTGKIILFVIIGIIALWALPTVIAPLMATLVFSF